ncbi:MAG: hypothetical protein V4864_17670 [Pseudomonadota bacterium]
MRHSYALIVANWFECIALRRSMHAHPALYAAGNQPYAKAMGANFVLRAKPVSTLRRNSDFVQLSWHTEPGAAAQVEARSPT